MLRQTRLDTDTAAAIAHRNNIVPNQTPLNFPRKASRPHEPRCEQVKEARPRSTTASSKAAMMAVILTAEEGLGPASDWARIMWITRIAVVGRMASVPSPAGSIRGMAMSRVGLVTPGIVDEAKPGDSE